MNPVNRFRLRAIVLPMAIGLAATAGAQTLIAVNQQDEASQNHPGPMIVADRNDESAPGQEAQQKVMLEVVAADAEVVKSKPYSADSTTETVQTLADGNRIVHRTVSKFYRDSEGRTRREQTFGNVDPEHPAPHEVKIFIEDPVGGSSYIMDPASKTADLVRHPSLPDGHSAEEGGKNFFFKTFVEDGERPEQTPPTHMMINFTRDSNNPNLAVITPDFKRDAVKEDLGSRSIEGVDCTGTRETTTIPAGEIGNEKPISVVRETWYAPSIAAVVLSTTDDPRYGKTTYQLSNVQLNEPARSLFEPPANFKVSQRK